MLQKELEVACKNYANLKASRENLHRLSMTTLIECLVHQLYRSDRGYLENGKHAVEEKLTRIGKAKASEKEDEKGPRLAETRDRENPKKIKQTVSSPLKLLGSFVENQDRKHHPDDEFAGDLSPEDRHTPRKLAATTKRGVVEIEKAKEIDDPVIESIRLKKNQVSEELRLLQGTKAEQTGQVVKSLAELSILNKELKNLNSDYIDVCKRFDSYFKSSLYKQGKKHLPQHTIDSFNKMVADRKTVDHMAEVNSKLGSSFLRFTTKNLVAIKSEEVQFYEKIKRLKAKSTRQHNIEDNDSSDSQDNHLDYHMRPSTAHLEVDSRLKASANSLKSSGYHSGSNLFANHSPSKDQKNLQANVARLDLRRGSDVRDAGNMSPSKKLDLEKDIQSIAQKTDVFNEAKDVSGLKDHNRVDIEHIQIARTQFSDDEEEY